MHCPKCNGEIPFYDIRPNCKHCGVNIWYYTQQRDLARDAKRTELEGFEAFTRPDDADREEPKEPKPVFGKPLRRVRRAL